MKKSQKQRLWKQLLFGLDRLERVRMIDEKGGGNMFYLGLVVGSVVGIATMCLMQINRDRDN